MRSRLNQHAFPTLESFDAADTGVDWDLYLRVMDADDPTCGTTHLLTQDGTGVEADLASFHPTMVGDFDAQTNTITFRVAFQSWATNLDPTDQNEAQDAFVATLTIEPPSCP